MNKTKTITQKQRKILELLYEYKILDTTTISRTVDSDHTLQATVITLTRMKAVGLLISRPKRPGPTLYSLSQAGAQAIGKELGSPHRRKPSRNVLQRRKSQLVLENEATTRGFIYYRPVPTSPTVRAKPDLAPLLWSVRTLRFVKSAQRSLVKHSPAMNVTSDGYRTLLYSRKLLF